MVKKQIKMKYINISWSQFNTMVNILSGFISRSEEKFDGIYGIPRGGLCLAVCLSHKLDIPLTITVSKNTLVVDDISDNGLTLEYYTTLGSKIATLFSTDWTITKPNWFIQKKLNKDEWIVFPWEDKMGERQTTLDEFEEKKDDKNTEK